MNIMVNMMHLLLALVALVLYDRDVSSSLVLGLELQVRLMNTPGNIVRCLKMFPESV